MSGLFNENGNFIQALRGDSESQRSHIGTMTTAIPLLCWAYQKTQDDSLREKIVSHCDTTM